MATETNTVDSILGSDQLIAVGKVLAGIWSAYNKHKFDEDLLSKLNDLQNTVNLINEELKTLSINVEKNSLYADIGEAQFQIEKWYNESVTSWMQGNTGNLKMDGQFISKTSKVGMAIDANCADYLNNINFAIVGGGSFSGKKWLQLAIDGFLATSPTGRLNQTTSFVESSYRYFIKLVHLQLQGIACLRAINSDSLGRYTYIVLENIIAQGSVCQEIVNTYLPGGSSSQKEQDNFNWIGNNTNTSNNNTIKVEYDADYRYFSLAEVIPESGKIPSGFEFSRPAPGSNQWGISMASGTPSKYGVVDNQSWGDVVFGKGHQFENLVPTSHGLAQKLGTFCYCTEDIVLPEGNFIISLVPAFTQGPIREGYSDGILYSDLLNMGAHCGVLDATGEIIKGNFLAQSENSSNDYHHVTSNQFSARTPSTGSPITGIGFCTNHNQVSMKLQTSMNAKSFAPLVVDGSQFVIFNPLKNGFLTADFKNQSLSFNESRTKNGSQVFTISGANGDLTFGTKGHFEIKDGAGTTYYLSIAKGYLSLSTKCDNVITCCSPSNVNNSYGSAAVPKITNWSVLALENQDNTFLSVEVASEKISLESPKLLNNGDGVESIYDTSFLWNFIPYKVLKVQQYKPIDPFLQFDTEA
ncbi:MAG: hypothetical protein Crog4KO_01560 [Crocinitomicaceae bacterium]